MACVFYEMFSTEDPGEDEDVNDPKENPNEEDQDNASAPQEGNFLSVRRSEGQQILFFFKSETLQTGPLLEETRISSTNQMWQSFDIGIGLLIGADYLLKKF